MSDFVSISAVAPADDHDPLHALKIPTEKADVLEKVLEFCGTKEWELWASCSHPRVSVTKQYNLVPAKGR